MTISQLMETLKDVRNGKQKLVRTDLTYHKFFSLPENVDRWIRAEMDNTDGRGQSISAVQSHKEHFKTCSARLKIWSAG